MSETEYRAGKLIPVEIEKDIEVTAKKLLDDAGIVKADYYDSFEECLTDELYGKYIVVDGKIFVVEEKEVNPYEDIFNVEPNGDGSFNFTLKYYNGGCGFGEAIENGFKKLKS